MRKLRQPTPDEQGELIAWTGFIFGAWVRLFPAALAGFPINDGGLFYRMMTAIQQVGLRWPASVAYNGLEIPFAYPPLAFYVAVITGELLNVPLLRLLQWLPALYSIATLIAFHGLARTILSSRLQAGVATLIFALTPRSITWLVMGGGITRGLGQFFLILTATSAYRLFTQGKKHLGTTILFGTCTVLTHPEAAVHALGIGLFFWLWLGRNKPGTQAALTVGAAVIALTSIWWMSVLLRNGPDPFLSALHTGTTDQYARVFPLLLTFSEEPLMTVVMPLALIGLALRLAAGNYLLPGLLILPFLVEPRSAPTVAMLPVAMLAAVALCELIFPAITALDNRSKNIPGDDLFQSRSARALMLFTGLYLLGTMFLFGSQLSGTRVSPEDQAAFAWVEENTPAGSHFLLMTGEASVFCDAAQEWFPVLADRVSIATVQGREWLDGETFTDRTGRAIELQNCLSDEAALSCLEDTSRNLADGYDYVYVKRVGEVKNYCRAIGRAPRGDRLIAALRADPEYQEEYTTEAVAIFSHRSHP